MLNKNMSMNVYSSIMYNHQNQNNSNAHQLINLKHVVCPHSGVLFIKLNDVLAHATQQMNLEHIMVQAKRAEHRRSMTCVIPCR